MKRVWIFGDSFAANSTASSWVTMLADEYQVLNYASNGSSEYRIWKMYHTHKHNIMPDDRVIFCHTSPYRIFLKNTVPLLSRVLPSHPYCDLLINDIIVKNETKFVNLLKTIWDEQYFADTFALLVNDLPRCHIHLTFFESNDITSLNAIWKENQGTVNHMNDYGNQLVLDYIITQLKT